MFLTRHLEVMLRDYVRFGIFTAGLHHATQGGDS